MFFRLTDGYGWNESWWWAGSVSDSSALTTSLNNFAKLRLALMVNDVSLLWIRLQSAYKRDPFIYDYTSQSGYIGAVNGQVNNVSNRVLVRLEKQGIGYNKIFFGGINDALIADNRWVPDAEWQSAFDALRNFVFNSGNINVRASVDNPQTPVKVVAMERNFPKGIKVEVLAGSTLTVGQKVRIKGASVIGYNGVKTVVQGPPDTQPNNYICGGAKPQQDNPDTDNVTATPYVYSAGIPDQFFAEGFSQRNPGRPFGFVRGRKPTVLSLRP
jgi:hypothetical protein